MGTTFKPFKKENVDIGYHLFQMLHQEVADYCGIFAHGHKTLKQKQTMEAIYEKGQSYYYNSMDKLFDFILSQCGCACSLNIKQKERDIC